MTARPSRLLFLSASFVMASFVMALTISASSALSAQSFSASPCHGDEGNTHNNSFFGGNQEKVCELRSATLPLVNGSVTVSGKNGGIELIGEDRSDIALEARVIVRTSSREKAEALFKEIKIRTDGSIRAEGPSTGWFGSSWNVNFKLRVPHHLAAELHTENGGIDLTRIDGNIHARTTNGGLSLRGLAGKVDATTTNGGVDVELEGSHWQGEGLEAKSINGGASLSVPDHYNAHLVATTVNGGVNVDFPVTVQGNIRNHLDTTLGQGGPTIHLETVNGGVDITRK